MLKKRFFIFLKLVAYFFLDNLAKFCFWLRGQKPEKVNEILIIGNQQIGDFVIWLDTLKEYKSFFKNEKIVLFCNVNLKDLAEKTKYFDEIIPINFNVFFLGNNLLTLELNFKNFVYRIKKLLELKKKHYKKILNPTNLFHISVFIKSLNADEKIGVLDKNKYLGDLFNKPYTKLIKLALKHELIDLAQFFREISGQHFLAGLPKFEFEIPKYKDLVFNENYCAISLSGSFPEKNWAVENFAKVLENFDLEIDIVLVGAKNETKISDKFLEIYNGKNKVLNLVGKTDLLEYLSIVKYARFVFGNDSSIIHFAVASRVPSVCITAGHGFGYCVPYTVEKNLTENEKKILPIPIFSTMDCFGCGFICKFGLTKNKKFRCVENIEIRGVFAAITKILAEINL